MKDNNSKSPTKQADFKQQMEEKKQREMNLTPNELVKLRQQEHE